MCWGSELSALDLDSRKLLWSTKLPGDNATLRPLVCPHDVYVPTARGIYDIDPANGDIRRVFRGADREAGAGRLLLPRRQVDLHYRFGGDGLPDRARDADADTDVRGGQLPHVQVAGRGRRRVPARSSGRATTLTHPHPESSMIAQLRVRFHRGGARQFIAAIVLPLACLAAGAAWADEGIVVRGDGSASGRPTQVEMSATITADAELAADAVVKFRDAKKRALAAMAALKNPDLSVISGGVSVGTGLDANAQMAAMRGMSVPTTNLKVRLSETSRILLAHTDKLEPQALLEKLLKVLDAAKDAGYQIGQAPASNYYEMQIRAQLGEGAAATVSFELPDATALRESLQGGDRRRQGQGPATGRTFRRQARSHRVGAGIGRGPQARFGIGLAGDECLQRALNKGKEDDKTLSSNTSGDLTLRVGLIVRFEIAK